MRAPVLTYTFLCLMAAGLVPGGVARAQGPENFTGTIADVTGSLTGTTTTPFTLYVDRYSTAEEAERLAMILAEKGPDALEDEMRKLEAGHIRIGARVGYPISFARSFQSDKGRVIRVATDRPLQMFEVMNGLRSQDYIFGFIELLIGDNGRGEGTLIAAAMVEFKEGKIEIKSYGTQPFRLMNVRQREAKKKK